jgi:hypothetical protein
MVVVLSWPRTADGLHIICTHSGVSFHRPAAAAFLGRCAPMGSIEKRNEQDMQVYWWPCISYAHDEQLNKRCGSCTWQVHLVHPMTCPAMAPATTPPGPWLVPYTRTGAPQHPEYRFSPWLAQCRHVADHCIQPPPCNSNAPSSGRAQGHESSWNAARLHFQCLLDGAHCRCGGSADDGTCQQCPSATPEATLGALRHSNKQPNWHTQQHSPCLCTSHMPLLAVTSRLRATAGTLPYALGTPHMYACHSANCSHIQKTDCASYHL